ncbi:sodium/proline symporter [Dysosmobacter sp.]
MTIILAVIAVYMLSMLCIGYRAKKSVKSSADFFIGGSRFGAALTAIAHQAAGLSGWLFIAWSQQVAGSGLGAIWTAFSSGFAPFINFFVMARRVAKFTVMTKARSFIDLIEARYYDEDRKIIRAIATVIIAISITVYMSSQLMAAGTTFQAVLGLDYRVSVLIGAVVVILYTSAGGLLAVAWTDFVQGMLMIFAVIVGLFVAFGNTGTLGYVMEEISAVNPALASPWINPITIVGLLSAGWLGYMGQPQIVQMFMGMKDPGSSKRGAVIAGTTGVFLLFGSFLVNLCCIVLFPNSENTSTNFIQMITQYTPHWLVGIVTAAILAAVMSSADALLHVATTAVTQDFYNKMLKKGQATDKEVLLAARVSSVLIGAFAIYIAFNPFDSILWVNWWAWGGLSVFAPILILGFYWKRATREGAMVSMVVGFVAVYAWYKAGLNTTLHYTFVAFTVTAAVLVAVSLVTKAPPARIQDMVAELSRGDAPVKEHCND